MNKEQLIEEARKRGIVPGAKVRHGNFLDYPDFIVPEYHEWAFNNDVHTITFSSNNHRQGRTIMSNHTWAEVVTPAPQPEGLVDGMACEPDEHMRAAIIAKAKELGMTDGRGYDPDTILVYRPNSGSWTLLQWPSDNRALITPGEFYDRLCKMKKPEPPIIIGSNTVTFNTGSITVGCTTIDNATVRAIAAKLKD